MKQTKSGPWVAGTVVVSLLLGVAGWFLLISPAFAEASETRVTAEAQVEQNDLTRHRINQLKAQFEQIDSLTAELDQLRTQIPRDVDLAEYRRQLATTAATHGVTIVALQTSTPMAVQQPAAPAPVDAGTEGDAEEGDAADDAAAPADDAAAPVAAAPSLLHGVPVTIDVMGTYPSVLAFLSDLQSAQPRLIGIESITATSQQAGEADGGKPATVPGDLGLVVTGYLWVLPETNPVAADALPQDPAPAPAPLPVPDPAKNPMVPLG